MGLIKRRTKVTKKLDSNVEVKPVELEPVGGSKSCASVGGNPSDPVEQARREAEQILDHARKQVKSIVEIARFEGYSAGVRKAAEDSAELLQEIQRVLQDVIATRDAILEDLEPVLLKLIVECVEKITRHEIKTDSRVVERTIKACLRRVRSSGEIWVRVNPVDVDRVKAIRDELLAVADTARELVISADRRVDVGGCIVESPSGNFDARISTQLKRVRESLMEAFRGAREVESGFEKIL
ncbi:MAG: FliH/SctL family protein [Armatimonadota bacterium]